MAKSVLVFLMHSEAQEERAVLLSLMTLEAVQRSSWDIFWKKENTVNSSMPLTKFNSSVWPSNPTKLTDEKAERMKPLVETVIVS